VNLARYTENSLILNILIFIVTSLLSCGISVATPSSHELALTHKIDQLTKKNRELESTRASQSQKLEKLTQSLHQLERLLLKRSFTPQEIQSTSKLTSSSRAAREIKSPLPKKKARFLSSAHSSSQNADLKSLFRRGPVLVALWATWCKPCVSPEEKTYLANLREHLRPYGVPLVSIGVDSWSKIKKNKEKWFYPLWHLKDAHVNLTPEVIYKKVGLGLPLFFLRMPDGSTPYFLSQTLSRESVAEWVTIAIRAKLQVFSK